MNVRNQRPWRHNCRLYNYHVKDTQCKVTGYHVKFARFVLLPVCREEAKTWLPFFCRSVYNKAIITIGFCDIQNNQGLGEGYQPQPLAYYSGYHKNLIQYLFTIYCVLPWLSCRFGAVVRALALPQCDPISIPELDIISVGWVCWFSTLLQFWI